MFFIISAALAVVALGSGMYFLTQKDTPPVFVEEQANMTATTTSQNGSGVSALSSGYIDCGMGSSARECIFINISNCNPARGTVVDERTGVSVRHVIDGYVNEHCSYQSVVVGASKQFAPLNGLDVLCLLRTDELVQTLNDTEGGLLLERCSGSYVDLLRKSRKAAIIAQ